MGHGRDRNGLGLPASAAIKVRGFTELHRALRNADRDTRLGVRKAEREVAEPVRVEAQELAAREISHIGKEWAAMKIGITQKLVYVAPKQRRRRGTPRPNLAGLLLTKAMEPALERHRAQIERSMEQALDLMANNFNRGAA